MRALLWDVTPAEIDQVVTTNLAGTLHGCRVAIRGMAAQGGGFVYNMEGFGSDGRVAPGLTTYAATKAGITYLTNALVEETKDLPVKVGSINPGMVLTDMLRDSIAPDRADNARRIFNILADTVDTVTPWLADKVLANDERGAHIVWLTKPKIFGRFLMAPFRKRDIFALDDAPSG
ncbi:MAG: SDR family oxidoreductase [Caldilineaceae bacterium]